MSAVSQRVPATTVGMALVMLSALAFSMSGVLTKAIDADGWAIVCWRGLFGGLLVMAYVEIRRGGKSFEQAYRLGRTGWLLASVGSVATVSFIYAFKFTYVANVAAIYATAPFFAAIIAWLLMRERVTAGTMVAAAISAAGVGIIVSGGLGGAKLIGDLIAVVMTVLNATYIVLVRKFSSIPVVWASAASSLQLFVLGFLMTDPLAVSTADMVLLIGFGAVFAVAVILWTEGTKLIAASQSALLGTTEIPFATCLAFVFLNELPNTAGYIGGAVILIAVIGHAFFDHRKNQKSSATRR